MDIDDSEVDATAARVSVLGCPDSALGPRDPELDAAAMAPPPVQIPECGSDEESCDSALTARSRGVVAELRAAMKAWVDQEVAAKMAKVGYAACQPSQQGTRHGCHRCGSSRWCC